MRGNQHAPVGWVRASNSWRPTSVGLYLYMGACMLAVANGAEFFAPDATIWKLLKGHAEASSPVSAWREANFNDSGWADARSPIYYSTAATEPPFFDSGTFTGTRLDDMQNNYTCVFLRKSFVVPSVTNVAELTLTVACDDGFIAWINGQEVARYNVPDGDLSFDAKAFDSPSEPVPFNDVLIANPGKLLVDGTNLFAVQGFNRAIESSDFGFMAGLSSSIPLPPLADISFNQDRGFYGAPFSVTITCPTPGATVFFTTNGSSPASTNGQVYTQPIPISGTTVLRARAEKEGFQPTKIHTHSYLFINDIIHQSPSGSPPLGWPATWGGNTVDYGMDPNVVGKAPWNSQISAALLSIPTLSLVTDSPNLFDPDTGIYANASGEGRAWERACSVELLLPDGTKGFQEDAGVRIRGGFSRSSDNPKHSFRFLFRSEYGAPKLRYPLFGPTGSRAIDQFDLRTSQDGSWAYLGARDGFFVNDPFARDTQLATGQAGERGDFVHLYISGQYWGLYNTCERPEASYAATYFGDEPEDYDVLKPDPQEGYLMTVTDGNDLAWTELWRAATNGFSSNAAYFAVQGRDPDGTPNPARTNLLEVINLVDYLLTIFWIGDQDGPISGSLDDGFLNNYYAFRSRRNTGGFRFVTHDSEMSLYNVDDSRVGTSTRGDPNRGDGPDQSNPYYLWTRLLANPEFRLLVMDRIQKHFFNGGPLTTEACTARFTARTTEIHLAVIGESARWGDAKSPGDPITAADWQNAVNDKLSYYFPDRSAAVLDQLQGAGLWPPPVAAPRFSQSGGEMPAGFALGLTHTNQSGTIYYTIDGSDPRSVGGTVSRPANAYSAPITLSSSSIVRARVKASTGWSPLIEASFHPAQDFRGLRVTEVMFNPPKLNEVDGDQFEFIELKNTGLSTLDLGGVSFSAGIGFTFTNGTFLRPGGFVVLAANATNFASKYPGVPIQGWYTGKLDDAGETLTLTTPAGATIVSFAYDDAAPWPTSCDGQGYSLVLADADSSGDLNNPASWRASSMLGGSPGTNDPAGEIPRSGQRSLVAA